MNELIVGSDYAEARGKQVQSIRPFHLYLASILTLLAWLVMFSFFYGVLNQRVTDIERRMTNVENNKFATRDDLLDFKRDVNTRVEELRELQKLDR